MAHGDSVLLVKVTDNFRIISAGVNKQKYLVLSNALVSLLKRLTERIGGDMNIIVGGFYLIASITIGVLLFILAKDVLLRTDPIMKSILGLIILLGGIQCILAFVASIRLIFI